MLIHALIAVVVAALVYFVAIALGLPAIIATVAALLVLVVGITQRSRL